MLWCLVMMPSVLSGGKKIEREDDKVVKIRMEQHNICQSAGLMGPRRRFHQTKCCDFFFVPRSRISRGGAASKNDNQRNS